MAEEEDQGVFCSEETDSGEEITPLPALLNLSFNQDFSFFAAATDRGFRIFSSDTLADTSSAADHDSFRYGLEAWCLRHAEMLFCSSILAVVRRGSGCDGHPHIVYIWDHHLSRFLGKLMFPSEIKAVRLQHGKIAVALSRCTFVYSLENMSLDSVFDTVLNPKGLCALTQQWPGESLLLACPGKQQGQLVVEHLGKPERRRFIAAHDSELAYLALSSDGRFVGASSTKGTLIRVFNTADGTLHKELWRGADEAEIHSIAFSFDSKWLAVSSNKRTIHVFSLAPSVVPKHFRKKRSIAQFRLTADSKYIVGFDRKQNTVIILGMNGSFHRCEYDPVAGGEMRELESDNFLICSESEIASRNLAQSSHECLGLRTL